MKNDKIKLKRKLFLCTLVFLLMIVSSAQVYAASVRISLNKTKVSITIGTSVALKATVLGKSGKVYWSTSNNRIAKVNSNGKVTGIKAGTAKITAKIDGKKAICTVIVKNKKINSIKKQHSMYVPYIKKLSRDYKKIMGQYGYTSSKIQIYFAFVDINKDGIDECICHALYEKSSAVTTCDYMDPYNEKTYIYTIYNNKVKAIVKQDLYPGAHSDNVQVYKNREYVELWWSNVHSFYKISKGSLSKAPSGKCASAYCGSTWTVNEKKVSRSKYLAYMKKMTNNNTGYRMYKFTENNLKKFL